MKRPFGFNSFRLFTILMNTQTSTPTVGLEGKGTRSQTSSREHTALEKDVNESTSQVGPVMPRWHCSWATCMGSQTEEKKTRGSSQIRAEESSPSTFSIQTVADNLQPSLTTHKQGDDAEGEWLWAFEPIHPQGSSSHSEVWMRARKGSGKEPCFLERNESFSDRVIP